MPDNLDEVLVSPTHTHPQKIAGFDDYGRKDCVKNKRGRVSLSDKVPLPPL
jgi:hypothetical protein